MAETGKRERDGGGGGAAASRDLTHFLRRLCSVTGLLSADTGHKYQSGAKDVFARRLA